MSFDPFVDAGNFAVGVEHLVEAVLTGHPVHFGSPRGILLAGTGPWHFREDMPRNERAEPDLREVPIPS